MPGSASTVVLGYQTDLFINGVEFGVRSGTVEGVYDKQECGDTISGRQKMNKSGRGEMQATVEFYEKSDVTTFSYVLEEGAYIQIQIYPKGVAAGEAPWQSDFFNVERLRDSYDVDGKVQGTFSGQSSGGYSNSAGTFGP